MNFTKQTTYALELDYDNYWLRRASKEVIEGWGLGRADLGDIRFSTKELAAEAARAILQRHMELTPHCAYPRFESADDVVAAARSIAPRSASVQHISEGRFTQLHTHAPRAMHGPWAASWAIYGQEDTFH